MYFKIEIKIILGLYCGKFLRALGEVCCLAQAQKAQDNSRKNTSDQNGYYFLKYLRFVTMIYFGPILKNIQI
jgi:hypothetical protein